MKEDKKIWLIRPSEKILWEAKTKTETEFVERIWLAEWVLAKWEKGDVVLVEHIHANSTDQTRM